MKNPYGVEPTRFLKKKDNKYAICCDPHCGPIFGSSFDIGINSNCNNKNGGWTNYGNSDGSYECRSPLKRSLFVNTDEPDQINWFKVSDYEVFTYN